jgi:hypothetical protein
MDDLRTRALLVDYDPTSAGPGAIGTVISRDEVATAARGEFPATLLIELDRVEAANGHEVTAHAQVAVDWDEDTLNQVLAATDDEEIALWFDERELAQAFDEVEGHGLRQRAAVLAIAVAAAGASTTPAYARFAADPDGGGGSPAAAAVAGPSGATRGMQLDQQIAATPSQSSSAVESTATSSGGGGLSSNELAGIVGGAGALLISAAGFGLARKRTPPVHPA